MKKRTYTTVEQIHRQWMKDPNYRKAYDDLELEFNLISALIAHRLGKGLTQKQLAEKVGTKQSAIARFESGNCNPSLAFIKKLARALDTKLILV